MKRNGFYLFIIFIASVFLVYCESGKTPTDKAKFIVGINQFAQHPMLDGVYEGLKERLDKEGSFELRLKIANADIATANQINNQFIIDRVDLIAALGTPSAQSAIKGTKEIPVVFGAITDPVGAGVVKTLDKPEGNKTGTTDRWPYEKQVSLIKIIKPDAKTIGIITNPGEDNCVLGMTYIKKAAESMGLRIIEVPVTNTSEVFTAAKSLAGRIDVFFISPSNTLISGISGLIRVADERKIPVIGGDRSTVKDGSLVTYGFNYKNIGISTAEVIIRILKNKEKPGGIPVVTPDKIDLYFNETAANKLKINIPKELSGKITEKF